MVMSLGMSPEIGQRQLGGQQGGGPFMGRDFMGQGAPPMSQALKQQVDDEAARPERRVVGSYSRSVGKCWQNQAKDN